MEKVITFLSGLPGAGKSTLIDQDKAHQLVCPDDIRLAWGHVYCQSLESMVHAVCETMVRAAMIRGREIVVDECFTKMERLKPYVEITRQHSYTPQLLVMTTPVDLCITRALRRIDGKDWEAIIQKKAEQWLTDWPFIKQMFHPYNITHYPYPASSLVEDIEDTYELF